MRRYRFAAVSAAGRKARDARAVDLMIEATALASGLPLYTRNRLDFGAFDEMMTVVVA